IVSVAAPSCVSKIQRIPFAMRERSGVGPKRAAAWQTSAAAAIAAFDAGAQTVVFATVGDPAVFSTFSYLRGAVHEAFDDVEYQLIPGITAMQALAAASGTPLVEGREILALVPATVGAEKLGQVLDVCDTVTIYKAGRQLNDVVTEITSRGRTAIVGTNVTLPEEQLRTMTDPEEATSTSYFSAVLSAPTRTINGGRI
ncbi:MAG: precorrin-2 C(20)-methyltransferase, partial [Propionibacteriaceae bacterium]